MRDFLTPEEAAKEAQITGQAMRDWCVRYGIGRKVGGRWRINPNALRAILNGETKPQGE